MLVQQVQYRWFAIRLRASGILLSRPSRKRPTDVVDKVKCGASLRIPRLPAALAALQKRLRLGRIAIRPRRGLSFVRTAYRTKFAIEKPSWPASCKRTSLFVGGYGVPLCAQSNRERWTPIISRICGADGLMDQARHRES